MSLRRSFPHRVIVGLSGGVDSSVAALLLQRAGFRVAGCFMRNWDRADEVGSGLKSAPCPIEADYASAAAVARALDIPLFYADFSVTYWNDVFERALESFARGMTPNPDTACNRFIKFGAFRERAIKEYGADLVATGHYAQIWPDVSRNPWAPLPPAHDPAPGAVSVPSPLLLSATDKVKDQSDFLALVPGAALARVVFPLGRFTKASVRSAAARANLPTAGRKDSMGICFIGPRSMQGFLSNYISSRPGVFLELEKAGAEPTITPIGVTPCAAALTVGQGAKVAASSSSHSGSNLPPMFVVSNGLTSDQSSSTSAVWVVPGRDHSALYSEAVAVDLKDFNWISGGPPPELAAALKSAETRRSSCNNSTVLMPGQKATGNPTMTSHPDPTIALSEWLGKSACAAPPLGFPVIRLLFRDRHREWEVRKCTATISWLSEFTAACQHMPAASRTISFRPSIVVRNGVSGGDLTAEFMPPWASLGKRQHSRGEDKLLLLVRFDSPHRAVTPGQVLVLYALHQGLVNADQGIGGNDTPLPSIAPETIFSDDKSTDDKNVSCWQGAGRIVLGGGAILCAAPSLWEQGRDLVTIGT